MSIDPQRNNSPSASGDSAATARGVAVAIRVIIVTFFILGVITFIAGLLEALGGRGGLGSGGFTSTSISFGDLSFETNTSAFVLMLIGFGVAVVPTGLLVQVLGATAFYSARGIGTLLTGLFSLFHRNG
jgi:hypothetical protein